MTASQPSIAMVSTLEAWSASRIWFGLVGLVLVALTVMFLAARARRREAERQLLAQKERYELAIRHSTEGMWDWDVRSDMTYWSRRMAQVLGVSADQSSQLHGGDLWQSRLHPEDKARVMESLREHLTTDRTYDVEYRLRTADGSFRWFRSRGRAERDSSGQPIRMTGSLVDVTAQVEAQQALRESEERFRLAAEAGRIAVWSVDLLKGRLDADPLWHELRHGVPGPSRNLSAEDWRRGVHADDLPKVEPLWEACCGGAVDRYDAEFRVVHEDGSIRWLAVRARNQRDGAGKVVAIRGTTQDVTERNEALDRLREAQSRLEAVTDNVPGMVYRSVQTEGTRHRVQYVSRGALELLGVPAERLVNQEIELSQIVLPEDRSRLQGGPPAPGQGAGERQAEYRIRHVDGSIKWIRDVARFRREADGTTVWDGMLIDQTALRAADEARALTEERYRLVIEASRAGVWDCDLAGNGCYVSDELSRRYGLDGLGSGEVLSRWEERIHPDDQAMYRSALEQHLRDSTVYDVEFRARVREGEYRWVRSRGQAQRGADGRAVRMIASVVDVHERKSAELALRESERKYRTIVETADEGIWLVDRAWRTTFVNARMAEMLGTRADEMIGRTIVEFMDDEGRAMIDDYKRRRESGLRERHEFKFVRTDGSPIWTSISTNPVFDQDGAFAGALAMVTDVSGQRESDKTVRRMRGLFLSGPVVTWHWRNAPGWPVEYVSDNVTLLGYRPEEFMSGARSFASIVYPSDLDRVGAEVQEHVRRGERTFRQEYRVMSADGRVRWLADYSVVERDSNGEVTHFAGYTFDDTERKGQEQVRAAEQRVLELIAGGAPLGDALRAIVRMIDEAEPGIRSSVLLLNPDGSVAPGPAPRLPEEFTRALAGVKIGPEEGSCGAAMYTGRRVITADIANDPRWTRYRQDAQRHGLAACWSEPIIGSDGRVLGSLAMYASAVSTPTERQLDIIHAAAHLAGIAIERRHAEQTLRDREQRLRLLVDSTPLGVITFDTAFNIVEWNHGAERIFGYESAEAIGKNVQVLVPEESREYVARIIRDLLARQGGFRGTNANVRKDGRLIMCEWYNSPLISAEGRVIAVACVVDDVTETHEARQRQDLMMVELDHRVKNNLAIIMAMAQQTAQASGSTDEFQRAFFGRLRAMSRMHNALARANWRGIDLEQLVRETLESYAPGAGPRSEISGPSLTLSPRASQAIAITLNELATNAVKYGSLSVPGGTVSVTWEREGSDDPGWVTMTWRERDGPPVHEPTRRGLGCALIETIVAHELNGAARQEFQATGLVCVVRFLTDRSESAQVKSDKGHVTGEPTP